MEPVTIGSGERQAFCFSLASCPDKVWELPLVTDLPLSDYRAVSLAAEKGDGGQSMLFATLDLLDKLAPGLSEVLKASDAMEVIGMWAKASGVSMGEFSASPA